MSDVQFSGRVRLRDLWRVVFTRKARFVVDFDELLAAVQAADRKNQEDAEAYKAALLQGDKPK